MNYKSLLVQTLPSDTRTKKKLYGSSLISEYTLTHTDSNSFVCVDNVFVHKFEYNFQRITPITSNSTSFPREFRQCEFPLAAFLQDVFPTGTHKWRAHKLYFFINAGEEIASPVWREIQSGFVLKKKKKKKTTFIFRTQ